MFFECFGINTTNFFEEVRIITQDRMNGMIIGILYIVAVVTSIIAVVFYQPVLSEQWYMAFPYLRRWNEHIALGYLCFRFMEAIFIAIGLVSILGLL